MGHSGIYTRFTDRHAVECVEPGTSSFIKKNGNKTGLFFQRTVARLITD